MLQENFEVVDAKDAAVADFTALAEGKYLDVPPAAVERVTERNDVTQFQDRAVGFISHPVDVLKVPYGNIDRVAGHRFACKTLWLCQRIEHCASGGYVYRASHQV